MSRPRIHKTGLPPYVRVRHGSYVYKDHALCRVTEGLARMYQVLGERLRGPDADSVPAAVVVYKREYLPTLAQSSRRVVEQTLDRFAHEFAEFAVADVQPMDMYGAIDALYPGKPAAARNFRAYASGFFAWTVRKGMREANPCKQVRLAGTHKYQTPWTDEAFHAIRDKLQPMLQVYHDLSFLVFQRTTDIRLLRRSTIFGGAIHFAPTKTFKRTGKKVDWPVTPEIQAVLDRAAAISKEWGVISEFVVHTRGCTAFTNNSIYSAYRRADIEAHGRATGLNPKALRPYAMTTAKRLGYTMDQLQVAAVHSQMSTTEGYIQRNTVPVSQVVLTLPERKK